MAKRPFYTLSEAWSGVNWEDLMAARGAFGTNFYDRSILYILRPQHRAYYRSGRPVIKIGPKCAPGSHEIHPIHSAPSLGQSILLMDCVAQICPQEGLEFSNQRQQRIS